MHRLPLGIRLFAVAALWLAAEAAQAATITVNTTADGVPANDGVCTLREAILAANTNTASGAAAGECVAGTAGLDTIAFTIPGAGVQTITLIGPLPIITEAVFINGYSQPLSSANTNPLSADINSVLLVELDTSAGPLRVNADGSTVRGLIINRGSDSIDVIASNVTIAGNFIGTNSAGTAGMGSNSVGVTLTGNNNVVGGAAAADRNLISGYRGGSVEVPSGTGNLIQGNYLGPDVTGTVGLQDLSATPFGVSADPLSPNTSVLDNLISGNANGVIAYAAGDVIRGNLIGTQRDGVSPLGNPNVGVYILGNGVTVGGTVAGQGNTIAFSQEGIRVQPGNFDGSILGNSIFSSGRLGINLSGISGPVALANDGCDVDTAPGNRGQNYPVLTAASIAAGTVTISGTLNSTLSTNYRLEFYSNAVCGVSGNGEGKTFLGFANVTTDASCNASFNNVSLTAAGGTVITALATVDAGAGVFTDTSEFSACLAAGGPVSADLSITKTAGATVVAGANITYTLTATNAGPSAAANVVLSDTLPPGTTFVSFAGPAGWTLVTPAVGGTGTVTASNPTLANGGSGVFTLVVNVNAATAGGTVITNTGTVSSATTDPTPGNNSGSAVVTVVAAPSIATSFGAATIPLNASTSMSFTITNPNAGVALTGVAITDTLPAGLIVANPNGLTGSCGGGAITAVAGSGTVSLAGATLAAGAACTFGVNVTGTTAGLKTNSVAASSTQTGAGNTATANLTVVGPPTIAKQFGAASLILNASTSLTFTLTNPNATTTLSGIGFIDTLPAGLVISTPNGLSGSCGGGTITAVAGSNSVSLSGATLAAGASCSFLANVTATGSGPQNNITGAVTSTEGGSGGSASASVFSGAVAAAAIPALHDWMLALLALLLSITGFGVFVRRRR